MTQLKEIKLIRFNTGEDIIASCIVDEETDSVLLDNPMKVLVTRSSETKQTLLLLMPWLPIELIEEDSIYVSLENVVTFMTPRMNLIEYYMNMMEVYEKILDENEVSEHEEDDADGDELLDDEIDRLHEYIYESKDKKYKLH